MKISQQKLAESREDSNTFLHLDFVYVYILQIPANTCKLEVNAKHFILSTVYYLAGQRFFL
jgi:hypothetical protein